MLLCGVALLHWCWVISGMLAVSSCLGGRDVSRDKEKSLAGNVQSGQRTLVVRARESDRCAIEPGTLLVDSHDSLNKDVIVGVRRCAEDVGQIFPSCLVLED